MTNDCSFQILGYALGNANKGRFLFRMGKIRNVPTSKTMTVILMHTLNLSEYYGIGGRRK